MINIIQLLTINLVVPGMLDMLNVVWWTHTMVAILLNLKKTAALPASNDPSLPRRVRWLAMPPIPQGHPESSQKLQIEIPNKI